jgi:putative ABC transport system permease protein
MRLNEKSAIRLACWAESARFAFWALAIDPLKAALTMLGVVIGSAALVLVITIQSVGKTYIVAQVEGIGSNLAYATLDRTETAYSSQDEIALADLAAIRERLAVAERAAGTYDIPIDITLAGRIHRAMLVGVTEQFEDIRRLRITSGRYFSEEDFASHAKICLITDDLAAVLSRDGSLLGTEIQLNDIRCTVIGTFVEGVPTFGQSEIQKDTVLMPFPVIRDITGDQFLQVLYVQAHTPSEVAALTRGVAELLSERHRPQVRYAVENLSSLLETAKRVSRAMTVVLFATALMTLIIAGVGIMNIMLANVAERTHEIGIRRAIGATQRDIRRQFLLEAVFLSFSGALLGVVVAISMTEVAKRFLPYSVDIHVSWLSAVIGFVLPVLIGVVFGNRPAAIASTLSPIDAIRIE